MNRYQKTYVYIIAGACGMLGFILTYFIIGWFLKPVENWVEDKLK